MKVQHITTRFGTTRYIVTDENPHGVGRRSTQKFVKLYLKDPATVGSCTAGFSRGNYFHNSCAPNALIDLRRWYGGTHTRPTSYAKFCGRLMSTNDWGPFGAFPGTSIGNMKKGLKAYAAKIVPPGCRLMYIKGTPGYVSFKALYRALRAGHPAIISYKTAAKGGHFALVIGLEWKYNKRKKRFPTFPAHVWLTNIRKSDAVVGGTKVITGERLSDLWERAYLGPFSSFFDPWPMLLFYPKDKNLFTRGGTSRPGGSRHMK